MMDVSLPTIFRVREAVFVYRQWLLLLLIVIVVPLVGEREEV
jgi:hypothetical protein